MDITYPRPLTFRSGAFALTAPGWRIGRNRSRRAVQDIVLMRRAIVLILLAAAACKNEPTFDERYKKAEAEIEHTSDSIESELNDGHKKVGREATARSMNN